jgi:hypothetical protein
VLVVIGSLWAVVSVPVALLLGRLIRRADEKPRTLAQPAFPEMVSRPAQPASPVRRRTTEAADHPSDLRTFSTI